MILNSKGFLKEEGDSICDSHSYLGEIQGSLETRLIAASLGKYYPQAFSLESLKKQKRSDSSHSKNYSTAFIRFISHVLALNDASCELKAASREGFHESFTIPRIAASFEKFANETKSIDENSLHWILSHFIQTTISEMLTQEELEDITKTLQAPDFLGPLIIGSGYDWHFTGEIFFGDYLFRCNRGRGAIRNGIDIYKMDDKSQFSQTLLRYMGKRQERTSIVEFKNTDCFYHQEMPKQSGGHCTENSAEAILLACIAIKKLLDKHQIQSSADLEKLTEEEWYSEFEAAERIYREWDAYDKEMVLQELLLSAAESINSDDIELQKLYASLLFDLHEQRIKSFLPLQQQEILDTFGKLLSSLHQKGELNAVNFILQDASDILLKCGIEEDVRIEIAKQAAKIDSCYVSRYIKHYHIDNEEARIDIAKIAAQHKGFDVSISINNYDIKNEIAIIDIYRISAKANNMSLTKYLNQLRGM